MPQFIAAAIAFLIPTASTTAVTIGGTTLVAAGTATAVGGYALLAGNVIFTGALIGASYAMAQTDVPDVEVAKATIKRTIPPRRGVVGRARVGGTYLLFAVAAGVSHDVFALAHGETVAFERFYLNEDVVVPGDGDVVAALSDNRYGGGRVRIVTRPGLSPEAVFDELVTLIDDESVWGDDHRGDGFSKIWLACKAPHINNFRGVYPYGLPDPSVVVRQNRYFDPRDEAQDFDDPATWGWSDNPALTIPWYLGLKVADGGFGWDRQVALAPVQGEIAAEADLCDDDVPLKGGGTVKRWRAGLVWDFTTPPDAVVSALLAACNGWMVERGDGTLKLIIGRLVEPTVRIRDRHILSLSVRRGYPDADRVDGVVVRYRSPPHEYATVASPVYPPSAQAVYTEGDARIRLVDVPACQDGYQAQRLAKQAYLELTAPIYGSAVVNHYGVTLFDEQTCWLESEDDPDLVDGLRVKIANLKFDPSTNSWSFDWRAIDFDAYNSWDPASEEGPLQPVVPQTYDEGISAPALGIPVVERVGDISVVELEFATPDERAELVYEVEWRLSDVGGGVPGEWQSGGTVEGVTDTGAWTTVVTLAGLPPAAIDLRLFAAGTQRRSAASNIVSVDTRLPAPGSPTIGTVAIVEGDVFEVGYLGDLSSETSSAVTASSLNVAVNQVVASAATSTEVRAVCHAAGEIHARSWSRSGDTFTLHDEAVISASSGYAAYAVAIDVPDGGYLGFSAAGVMGRAASGTMSGGSYTGGSDTVTGFTDSTPNNTTPYLIQFRVAEKLVKIPVTAANSASQHAVQLYRVAAGGGFGSAVPVGGLIYVGPNGTADLTDQPPFGASYDYFVVALSSSGAVSSPSGPVTLDYT